MMKTEVLRKETKKVDAVTSSWDILKSAKELEKRIDITLGSESRKNDSQSSQKHEQFLSELQEMEKFLAHSN
ncbi:hypothetical protein MUO14_03450 [Halobacillus shinanisalinarum]|uniref:Uncharacterized protein n=1 Tax=Halobacillus shinanisalinarum TaxID=2932258 RepID=A0ABY4H1I1_9BACI|nr:hypothetical protein [Halobacillus shinanisalinarum]UOQ94038.1 hypothetical protein MUO14_03450 [Halobacillus shinanisalinarum]